LLRGEPPRSLASGLHSSKSARDIFCGQGTITALHMEHALMAIRGGKHV